MTNQWRHQKKTNRIIVISAKQDAHIPFVQQHLEEPCVVIDPSAVPDGEDLTYQINECGAYLNIANQPIATPRAVWYRKPRMPRAVDLPVQPYMKKYAASALHEHVAQLYGLWPEALWISDYFAIHRADNKYLQLQRAIEVGLNVPDTLITSSMVDAGQFIAMHQEVIVKSIAAVFPHDSGKASFFFARKISAGTSLEGLQYAPAIFQQCISAIADIRVNVVGERVFAAVRGVLSSERRGYVRDWRYASQTNGRDFQSHSLPDIIESACCDLVKKFNLQFGAIDLVLDQKGHYWFLEINPNGQWAFIEEATGQPIGKAIAELLSGRP